MPKLSDEFDILIRHADSEIYKETALLAIAGEANTSTLDYDHSEASAGVIDESCFRA